VLRTCVLCASGGVPRDAAAGTAAVTSSPPVLRRGRSVGQRSGRPPLESQATVTGVSPVPSPYRGAAVVSTGRESPISRATSLDTRSRSPSPHASVPHHPGAVEYYGTAKLTDRSRSPSPTPSLPVELERRPRPRPTPQKPTALDLPQSGRRRVGGVGGVEDRMPHVLPSPTVPPPPHRSPGSINFPRLSPSPSHAPWDPASPGASPGSSPLLPRSASSQLIGHASTREMGGVWAGQKAGRHQQRYPSQQALPLRPEPRYQQRPLRTDDPSGLVHLPPGGPAATLPHSFRPSELGAGPGAVPRPSHWGRDTASSPQDVDEDDEKNSESEDEDWC